MSHPMTQLCQRRRVCLRCAGAAVLMTAGLVANAALYPMIGTAAFAAAGIGCLGVGLFSGRWLGLIAGSLTPAMLFTLFEATGSETHLFVANGFGPGAVGFAAVGLLGGVVGTSLRRAQEARNRAVAASDILRLVASGRPLPYVLEQLAHRCELELPGNRCALFLVDAETQQLTIGAAPNVPSSYVDAVERSRLRADHASTVDQQGESQTVAPADGTIGILGESFRDLAHTHDLRVCWCEPILSTEDRVIGILTTYCSKPRRPKDYEVAMLGEVSRLAALAIQRQRDHDHRVELEAQIRLRDRLDSLGLLAGGIAHDLNNLLVGVLGNAEVALEVIDDEAAQHEGAVQESLQEIGAAATQAAALADQLLLCAGRRRGRRGPVNLSALVAKCTQECRRADSIHLEVDAPVDLPLLDGDDEQIGQMVNHLIDNALQSIGSSGSVRIAVAEQPLEAKGLPRGYLGSELLPGSHLSLVIEDSGCGMSSSTQRRIFEPFYSRLRRKGLGLASSLGIVRAHGGAIRVESQRGSGTRVTVLLPVATHLQRQPSREDTPLHPVPLTGTALVIDDDPVVRKAATRLLRLLGLDVLTATSGKEGVECFRLCRAEISVILIDLVMPDADGRDVMRRIQKVSPDVPIVLTSGYDPASLDRGDLGGVPFLHKPYRLEALRQIVHQALASRQRRRASA